MIHRGDPANWGLPEPTPYRTSDLYFAAYLIVVEVPFLGARHEVERTSFLFTDQGAAVMRDLKGKFFANVAQVPALAYAQAIRRLRPYLSRG